MIFGESQMMLSKVKRKEKKERNDGVKREMISSFIGPSAVAGPNGWCLSSPR